MNKIDSFRKAFARAQERKAKQQTNLEKVDNNTTKTTKTTTTIITTTQLDCDERYRTTTIQNMLNYINQKRK